MIPKYHRTVLIVFDLAMDFFNFGTSQLEQQIEAATDEKLNEPNWGENMLIVDLIAHLRRMARGTAFADFVSVWLTGTRK